GDLAGDLEGALGGLAGLEVQRLEEVAAAEAAGQVGEDGIARAFPGAHRGPELDVVELEVLGERGLAIGCELGEGGGRRWKLHPVPQECSRATQNRADHPLR